MMERQYKDSGIEWIGRIPEGWKTCRLKNLGFLYGGLVGKSGNDFNIEEGDKYSLYIPFTNIFNNDVIDPNNLHKVKCLDYEEQNEVKKGDLLFLMSSEDYDGIGKPSILQVTINPLYLNSFCKGFRITNNNIYPKYLYFFMSSHFVREQLRLEAKGFIRINLRQDKLSCCSIFLPPLPEQQRIASYLDKKCGEIDALIALQEKMIAQLTEYKQAVITEAVTKGLDPNAKLIPSGIEWIGDVPEGWRVCRIKDIVNLQSGTNLTTMDITETGQYPVYGGNGIRGYYHEYTNEGEFILIGRQGALCGNINYASGKFWATEHAVVCYPKREFARKWLGELLRAMNLGQYSLSAAQPGLSVERIRNLYMPLPPLPDQQRIASYLDTKCSEIDTLITLKRQKIESLNAYKKSVIYEAVTGKTII